MKFLTTLRSHLPTLGKFLLILSATALLIVWLMNTPPGLLGKADAVGYAICHRIAARSFFLADRQLPLCSRCSGMYLGALVGLLILLRSGRPGELPPWKMRFVFAGFLLAFAVDGINSYLHFFPNFPELYQPANWLRLLTGTGMGLGIAAFLAPVINLSLWDNYEPRPILSTWKQLGLMVGLAGLVDLALLSDNPLLLYPLAVLSSATVILLLAILYAILWVMLAKRENRFHSWRQVWVFLLAGFLTALVQIAVIDLLRFALTGTWAGLQL